MFRRVMDGQPAPQRCSEFITPPVRQGFSAVDVEIVDHQVDGSRSWITLDEFSDRLGELSCGALPTYPSEVPASLRFYGTESIRGSAPLVLGIAFGNLAGPGSLVLRQTTGG
jgi:hypothetical protein